MHAMTNNIAPKLNLVLLSSSEPEIIIISAINPKITGSICENIIVPFAILYHYYNLLIFKLFKYNLIVL